MDLVAWLGEQLDEDERVAREALKPLSERDSRLAYHAYGDFAEVSPAFVAHVARWVPDRVLAEVEAKRQILAEHHRLNPGVCVRCTDWQGGYEHQPYPCRTVLALAQPYAGRPGWRPEWAAEVTA